MESKYIFRAIGLAAISTFLFFGGVSLLENKPEVKFGRFAKEYKESIRMIDSTYNARKDSLKNWYEAQIDSLDKVYSAKKDLERLTN